MEEIQNQLEVLIDDVERDEKMSRADIILSLYKLKEEIEDLEERALTLSESTVLIVLWNSVFKRTTFWGRSERWFPLGILTIALITGSFIVGIATMGTSCLQTLSTSCLMFNPSHLAWTLQTRSASHRKMETRWLWLTVSVGWAVRTLCRLAEPHLLMWATTIRHWVLFLLR